MKMNGAKILVETLIEQGTKTIFGYPGGSVLNIYDELYLASDRITHILTAHEQGAAHAADGYARATGEVGVCLATSGPGATNLVTGIANAYLDSTPMVAITGNVAMHLIGRDSFQEVDITGITMPITKHNFMVKDVNQLASIIREAFKIAKSGRPGPVLIDIPKNIQLAEGEFIGGAIAPKEVPYIAASDSIKKAVKLIMAAKAPYIYCGGGVVTSEATEQLLKLAEIIDAPIATSMMGLSAIPYDNERFLGMTGMHGKYAASKAKANCDLLIGVGVRFSDRATGRLSEYAKNAKLIHIDIDPAEIQKNVPVDLGLIGDIKDTLNKLAKEIKQCDHSEWFKKIDEYKKFDEIEQDSSILTPKMIIEKVRSLTTDDTVIATDVGQHQMWTASYYNFKNPRTLSTSGGLGTMGYGMGAAIGACFGVKDKGLSTCANRTVLFTGDGSFGMNLAEMATAVTNQLPLVIVLFNNGVLGMVRQWQTLFYGQRYATTTLGRKTDYCKLAEAFGANAYRVEKASELDSIMEKAFAHQTPVLVECMIDKNEQALPMIPAGCTIDDIIFEIETND